MIKLDLKIAKNEGLTQHREKEAHHDNVLGNSENSLNLTQVVDAYLDFTQL